MIVISNMDFVDQFEEEELERLKEVSSDIEYYLETVSKIINKKNS